MQPYASRKAWPAPVVGARLAAPTLSHHQLSDFCQKLFSGAVNGQQYAAAWAALASIFKATSVQLLRDVSAPSNAVLESTPIHVLDNREPHRLPCALPTTDNDHGLLAIARIVPRGFDAIVVLRKEESFTEAECAWMELLLTHIREALDLGDQLSRPLPTAASAVQLARLFPLPCVLTDGGGRCLERNHAFTGALEKLSGDVRSGRVVFDDPALQGDWRQALLEGGITAATQSMVATTGAGERWKVHVVPFYCVSSVVHCVPQHLMFAIFEKYSCTDAKPGRPLPGTRALTKAELEVLANLLLGHTAKAIARQRGASVNTVRKQIANILGKTGHHTQKELMASFGSGALDAIEALEASDDCDSTM